MSVIYLVCGLPGSGKSTLSNWIHERTGATLIQSDVIRHELFGTPSYTKIEHSILFPNIRGMIRHHLKSGHDVIYDATNIRESDRKMTYKIAEEYGADLKILFVEAPSYVVQERMVTREFDSNMSDARGAKGLEVYEAMLAGITYPSRNYFQVDGTLDHNKNTKLKEYIGIDRRSE